MSLVLFSLLLLLPIAADAQSECWLTQSDFPNPNAAPSWVLGIESQCYAVLTTGSAEFKVCQQLSSRVLTVYVAEANAQNYAKMTSSMRKLMTDYLGDNQNALRNSVLNVTLRQGFTLLQFARCQTTPGDCTDASIKVIFELNSESTPIVSAEMRKACTDKWTGVASELEACNDCVDSIGMDIYGSNVTSVRRAAISKRLQRYCDGARNENRTKFLQETNITGWGSLFDIYLCDVIGNCSTIGQIYAFVGEKSKIYIDMEKACGNYFDIGEAGGKCAACASEIENIIGSHPDEKTRTEQIIAELNKYTNGNEEGKKFIEATRIGNWGKLSDILVCNDAIPPPVTGDCALSKNDTTSTTSAPGWLLDVEARCYAAMVGAERSECVKLSSQLMSVFVEEINAQNYAKMTDRMRSLMKEYIATNRVARSEFLRNCTFRREGLTNLLLFTDCVYTQDDCAYISRIFELDANSNAVISVEMRKACESAWKSNAVQMEACNDCADSIEMEVYANPNKPKLQANGAATRLDRYKGTDPARVKFVAETNILGWGTLANITLCK